MRRLRVEPLTKDSGIKITVGQAKREILFNIRRNILGLLSGMLEELGVRQKSKKSARKEGSIRSGTGKKKRLGRGGLRSELVLAENQLCRT